MALAQELELTGLANGAEEVKLESLKNGTYGQNLATFESDIKLPLTSKSVNTTPSPHVTRNIEDVSAKASETKPLVNCNNVKADLEKLDEQIKSMMTITEVRTSNYQKVATCNVCGKEASANNMPSHIEANHISGVSHSCNICGKAPIRSRAALRMHKRNYHKEL